MTPYLIINGTSSKSITGLMIQKLAPISKPLMRTNIQTVDGRDGDIVTPLGYSAYDKVVEIGLYGDYNVDDVIAFFNTSGTVIFSNESDKYYNFAIYEQIDLERLIRFKTATVTFHVQPFKYSADETAVTYNYSDVTTATINVRNNGNIYAKPTITITGSGLVELYIGDDQVLSMELNAEGETIIIDVAGMNAYNESGVYLNRQVTGDYSNVILATGLNTLTINGAITAVTIDNYSRWI